MRKICDSSKVSCRARLRATELARSVPNGFSMMMRERSASPAWPRPSTTSRAATGGTDR